MGNTAETLPQGGNISNAAKVVAGMRAAFRACYQKGLDVNPDAQGSVRLAIKVGPGGEVSNVSAVPSGNLPPMVVDCISARAREPREAVTAGWPSQARSLIAKYAGARTNVWRGPSTEPERAKLRPYCTKHCRNR